MIRLKQFVKTVCQIDVNIIPMIYRYLWKYLIVAICRCGMQCIECSLKYIHDTIYICK